MATIVESRAADCKSQISAFRRAHKLSSVTLDSKLNAVALAQAQAMSSSGKVSHEVGGVFRACGEAPQIQSSREYRGGLPDISRNVEAREESPRHRENLLMSGARKVGVAYVANPKSPYRMFRAMVITD